MTDQPHNTPTGVPTEPATPTVRARLPRQTGFSISIEIGAVLAALILLASFLGVFKGVEASPPLGSLPPGATSSGVATVTGSPTVSPLCPASPNVIWDNANRGHNAYSKPVLSKRLPKCQTLMVTSGHGVGPGGVECGYQKDQMCVFIFESSTAISASVAKLDLKHTWWGLTPASPDAAIGDKRPQWFAGPNCSSTGCAFATVYAWIDGVAQPPRTLRP